MMEYESHPIMLVAPPTTSARLAQVLSQAGYEVAFTFSSGADALREAERRLPALLIVTYSLGDMLATELIAQMPNVGGILLITPHAQKVEPFGSEYNVVMLSNPLSKEAFLQSVSVLLHMSCHVLQLRQEVERLQNILCERKTIYRAKGQLMDTRRITESEAHRYMQKMSMDTGRRLVDIAQQILSEKIAG